MRLCPVTGIANLFNCRKLLRFMPDSKTIGSQDRKVRFNDYPGRK